MDRPDPPQSDGAPISALLCLPSPVFIDDVFPFLGIRDLICIRQVCRRLYDLSHEAVVWKRLLQTYPLPLPPLPPTSTYSLESLSSFQAESLIVRPLSIDSNWRSTYPLVYQSYCETGSLDAESVLRVKLLAGGVHLVVFSRTDGNIPLFSVVNLSKNPLLSTPAFQLDREPVGKIEAKYMRYNGEYVIMVIWITCEQKDMDDDDEPKPDGYDYTHQDLLTPWRYTLHRAVVKVSDLETTGGTLDHKVAPNFPLLDPFDIDEIDGDPYLVGALGHYIRKVNLATGEQLEFVLSAFADGVNSEDGTPYPRVFEPYSIRAIRILPPQHEIVIVRTMDSDPCTIRVELVRIPRDCEVSRPETPQGANMMSPIICLVYSGCVIFSTIQISAHGLPGTSQPLLQGLRAMPPPISIFCLGHDIHTDELVSDCLLHIRLWPERITDQDARARGFTLQEFRHGVLHECSPSDLGAQASTPSPAGAPPQETPRHTQSAFIFDIGVTTDDCCHEPPARDGIIDIIPSTSHALFYSVDPQTRIPTMWSFAETSRVRADPQWAEDAENYSAESREREWVDGAMEERNNAFEELDLTLGEFCALDWDDLSGQMCLVEDNGKKTWIMQFGGLGIMDGQLLAGEV